MDEFKVEIDVQSYLTIVDGIKVYKRGKTWDFMVGRNLSVAQLKAVVEEKFSWSTDQRMTIWYGSGDNTIQLISESEIAELFDRCSSTKIVRFGVTIESKQQHNEPAPVMAEEDDDQPVHAPFFAWPKQAYAGEYEDDEPVGCNGESTYMQEENDASNENVEPEVIPTRVPLGTLDVDNSYDPQNVQGDDESLLANNVAPTYIHDKNNPLIKVGATFPDSKSFKVALRQLAIREDWSFDTEYSEPQRFRAKCTDEDCPWRIHASKIKNTKTFMVKKLPFGHTCGSANCSKGMANRDWLADKGKAAFQEDATVSAKQLKERLQREYDINLQYSDVWKGRARALDQLQGTYKENFQLLWSFRAELLAANPGSSHALRFIFSKKARLEEYVDEFFSVARFRAAYSGVLMPIRGRSQWPKVNPGFDMIPPKLTKSAGRPRTRRIKNYTEGGTGRKHKCKRCGAIGHLRKTCKEPEIESDADRDATPPPRKKSKAEASIATSSPKTPTKQGTQPATPTSPMTRQRAAAIAIASSPPSASTRSKTVSPSPLRRV